MPSSEIRLEPEPGLVMVLLQDVPASEPNAVAYIPADKSFEVPYHFHLIGEEYISVRSGYIDITLAGKVTRLTPEMGEFHIPVGKRHGMMKPEGLSTELCERAVPSPAKKNKFFENFLGHGKPTPMYALATFYRDGDSFPAFGDWTPDILSKLVVWIVGGFFGDFLGLAPAPDSSSKPKTT